MGVAKLPSSVLSAARDPTYLRGCPREKTQPMRLLCLSWLLPLCVAARAFAQDVDAGAPVVAPRSANPAGADDPAELLRSSGLADGGPESDDAGVRADLALSAPDGGAINPED